MPLSPIRFLAALFLLAAPPTAAADEAPAAPAAAALDQPLFALFFAPGPMWKPGRPFAEQGLRPHFDYWMNLHRQGRIASAGAVGTDSGLVVLRAADQAAADAILAADPAIVSGIFTGTIRPYKPPMINAAVLGPRKP